MLIKIWNSKVIDVTQNSNNHPAIATPFTPIDRSDSSYLQNISKKFHSFHSQPLIFQPCKPPFTGTSIYREKDNTGFESLPKRTMAVASAIIQLSVGAVRPESPISLGDKGGNNNPRGWKSDCAARCAASANKEERKQRRKPL